MKKTEEKIEEALNSLEGIERIQLSPLVADRIFQKAMEATTIEEKIRQTATPVSWVIGVAAVLVLNFGFLFWMNSTQGSTESTETLSGIYFDSEIGY